MSAHRSPPVVCTLGSTGRTARVIEWADLGDLALTIEPIPGGLRSTYPPNLADSIGDLRRRENDCCGSWMDISIDHAGDAIRLDVTTTNPEGVALIRSMIESPGPGTDRADPPS